jgi:hypothetical protein
LRTLFKVADALDLDITLIARSESKPFEAWN